MPPFPGRAVPWAPRIPGQMPAYPGRGGPVPAVRLPSGEMSVPTAPAGQPIIYPWWQFEMPGSNDWLAQALNFTAVGGATTTVPGFSFTVGQSQVGVIKQITMTVQNSLATINLGMTLLINNAPVQGWTNRLFPAVAATGVVVPFNDVVIRMQQFDVLTAVFTDVGGAGYTCTLQASGWQTPETVVKQFMGGVPY